MGGDFIAGLWVLGKGAEGIDMGNLVGHMQACGHAKARPYTADAKSV